MIGLRSGTQARVLELHKVADARVPADAVARPQARIGSDDRTSLHVGVHQIAKRGYLHVRSKATILHDGARADPAIFANFAAAQNLRERSYNGIRANADAGVD